MLLETLLGQSLAKRTLERALHGERLAQAYLFTGEAGVGKRRAALGLSLAALCTERPGRGCERCPTCKRILSGQHPDVRVFRPRDEGNRNLQVEVLREQILPVAQFAPFEAARAFLIFDEADVAFPEQHPEAANALLKTLEEPRPRVHFVLLAERPDRLLDTIRSRAQRVRFAPLARGVIERVLEAHEVPREAHEAAIALADGSAARALALAEDGLAQALVERALAIDETLARGRPGQLVQLAEELAKDAQLTALLDTLLRVYRDVATLAAGLAEDRLLLRSHAPVLRERARGPAGRAAPERALRLLTLGQALQTTRNPQILLDAALMELRQMQ